MEVSNALFRPSLMDESVSTRRLVTRTGRTRVHGSRVDTHMPWVTKVKPRLVCHMSHIVAALVPTFFCASVQFCLFFYLMPRFTLLTVLTDKVFWIERWKRGRLAKNETNNSILIA